MECDVAREALSARIDGEREPVPSRRVDEHLASCPQCRDWYARADALAQRMRRPAAGDRSRIAAVSRPPSVAHLRSGGLRAEWRRWALGFVGSLQVLLAAAQALGADIGTAGAAHAAMMSGHLVNESTAWAAALGVVMIVAALRPTAAAGLAGVLGVFTGLLVAYVIADALADAVTPIRMLSHLPALAGTVLAVLVWRDGRRPQPGPRAETSRRPDEITLPDNASRGRRRGHLWPTDGSAA